MVFVMIQGVAYLLMPNKCENVNENGSNVDDHNYDNNPSIKDIHKIFHQKYPDCKDTDI
jgi:hypothetical protein